MKLDKIKYYAAFKTGVAPEGTHFLVMAHNTDGRVCCWAKGSDLAAVKARVDEMWPTHGGDGCGCYVGEKRDLDEIKLVTSEPLHLSKVVEAAP